MALRALGDDTYFERSGFRVPPGLAERLALFARAYGMADKAQVAWALHQAKQRASRLQSTGRSHRPRAAAALRLIANQLQWLDDSIEHLTSRLD